SGRDGFCRWRDAPVESTGIPLMSFETRRAPSPARGALDVGSYTPGHRRIHISPFGSRSYGPAKFAARHVSLTIRRNTSTASLGSAGRSSALANAMAALAALAHPSRSVRGVTRPPTNVGTVETGLAAGRAGPLAGGGMTRTGLVA